MRLFFAGTEHLKYAQMAIAEGATSCLQSAFYLNYKKQPNQMNAPNFLLDSGGFTARKQGTPIAVEQYRDYVNQTESKVVFNLDTRDPDETLRNQAFLEKETKAYVIPVYHFSEFKDPKYRDLIDYYAKNYKYISLGGTAEGAQGNTKNKELFFDYCFSRVRDKAKVHGLAVTSYKMMLRYPWFSVDSTTWLVPEMYGQLVEFRNGQLIKHQSAKVTKKFTTHKHLIDDKKILLKESVRSFVKLEQYATKLWEARGVKFNDWPFKN